MKFEPLKLCGLDLGEGKRCERVAGHNDEHDPNPFRDFPVSFGPAATWDCPHCDWPPSYNPNDVKNRYCGHCHHFCEEI